MRRRTGAALVAAVAAGAIAAGSGVTAWATWTVSAAPARATVRAERMPVVENLALTVTAGTFRFSWDEARFASGAAVGGYRVLATAGPAETAVCETSTAQLSCAYSPSGRTGGTFVVRALAGSGWVGPASATVSFVPKKDSRTTEPARGAGMTVSSDGPRGSAPEATPGGQAGAGERPIPTSVPTTGPTAGPTTGPARGAAPGATSGPTSEATAPGTATADGPERTEDPGSAEPTVTGG
ncbi:hypothetical protein BJY16_000814 [Actinoplanes octamycinicus]|uniref:Fibronectin type-III domain-containing protein n=1 Tax=Actinoplanes octamycinicus TaxID=135948 RepID=A0A7W7M562_9ACTN|nr:hypothetical protein [Actinoplanes octamycinicus]MBB4737355.1 hypothetical protein [Actinoplanes octamycinicus]GIE60361.1 hypothetical protein Aoc01nite_57630 [Actinoplanes octamycinicus]